MDFIDFYYPNTCYTVVVRYAIKDVGIECIRCKEYPAEKDNARGFTANFSSYEEAKKYATHVAEELGFSF